MEKDDKRLAAAVAALRGLEKGDLETLLKAMITPPPDIVVTYQNKQHVISRKVLQLCSRRVRRSNLLKEIDLTDYPIAQFLCMYFTRKFNIIPLPGEHMKEGKESILGTKRQLRYVPLALYTNFIHGPAADGRYRELPWDDSWSRVVPNIESIVLIRTGDDISAGALANNGTGNPSISEVETSTSQQSKATLSEVQRVPQKYFVRRMFLLTYFYYHGCSNDESEAKYFRMNCDTHCSGKLVELAVFLRILFYQGSGY
ncbi:hypothetical protein M422DRAFT_40756 [Sphaerobolus stellatus SS14]|nr:hypothetical protein M422DRAFT_40756 [Sphaerobolus stellatus SS14]